MAQSQEAATWNLPGARDSFAVEIFSKRLDMDHGQSSWRRSHYTEIEPPIYKDIQRPSKYQGCLWWVYDVLGMLWFWLWSIDLGKLPASLSNDLLQGSWTCFPESLQCHLPGSNVRCSTWTTGVVFQQGHAGRCWKTSLSIRVGWTIAWLWIQEVQKSSSVLAGKAISPFSRWSECESGATKHLLTVIPLWHQQKKKSFVCLTNWQIPVVWTNQSRYIRVPYLVMSSQKQWNRRTFHSVTLTMHIGKLAVYVPKAWKFVFVYHPCFLLFFGELLVLTKYSFQSLLSILRWETNLNAGPKTTWIPSGKRAAPFQRFPALRSFSRYCSSFWFFRFPPAAKWWYWQVVSKRLSSLNACGCNTIRNIRWHQNTSNIQSSMR